MMTPGSWITAAATLGVLLFAPEARAATFNFCIRLPVTLGDEVGTASGIEAELGLPANTVSVNEIGTSGDWRARGIRIETLKRNGAAVVGFSPKFADPDTGCFSQTYTTTGGTSDWTIGVKSYGRLSGNNELRTHNTGGVTSYYEATFTDIPNAGGTFIRTWPTEYILLRMYAILAYAIEEGFRGDFANQTLRAWWSANGATGASPCGCDDTTPYTACACSSGGQGHIAVQDGLSNLKFVLGHEYGHRALYATLADPSAHPNNCSLDSDENGSANNGHSMTSLEWNSCAAMEGWAHFVSADIFTSNHHAGGDPSGWFRYFGDLIDAEAEWSNSNACSDYIDQYADQCSSHSLCDDPVDPDCDQIGTELDWMRTFWDYHTDDDIPGSLRNHVQLQGDIEASGGWAANTAWDDIDAGMTARGTGARWQTVGDYNGSSEP